MPAEWETHERCLMAWPTRADLWGSHFEEAKREFAATANAIARFEPLTLIVNPAKPEHVANPQELVNTVVHELVHASFDVQDAATRQGLTIAPPPLPEGATDLNHDAQFERRFGYPSLEKADWQRTPAAREYLEKNYGDSDSNPKEEFIDVNRAVQSLVQRVVSENLQATGIGRTTITGVDLA